MVMRPDGQMLNGAQRQEIENASAGRLFK